MFADRTEAGRLLGAELRGRIVGPTCVLGLARGGLVVAARVADALGARLDVVIPRKLGAPMNPELALGAVAPGIRVIDGAMVRRLHVAPEYLEAEIARAEAEIERRSLAYRGRRPPPELDGLTAVVVDDGVATGATAIAALRWARGQHPARVVFGAPVGPAETARRLSRECDEVVFLLEPAEFTAVGLWYRRFDQVGDEAVEAILAEHAS